MTTVIEPEQAQGSPKGKRLLFVIGGAVAAVALIIVGACTIGNEPPPSNNPLPPDMTQGPFGAEASLTVLRASLLPSVATIISFLSLISHSTPLIA